MEQTFCLIITSISGPENKVLQEYSKQCAERKVPFIMAGDVSSPPDFSLEACEYLAVKEQVLLPFELPKLLPDKHYSKKNAAYLRAMQRSFEVIVETDDDNLPYEEFWKQRNVTVSGQMAPVRDWLNVYHYFSDEDIWPRGFALKQIEERAPTLGFRAPVKTISPIQQTLCDENPDVDAIYRLSCKLPIQFKKRLPVLLPAGSTCPFNSQNTTWFRETFPLMYLPSYCSFRMCDIWRSFVAQRILWANDWSLSFHESNMYQQRNEHNLLKDLEDEVSGYVHNPSIVNDLAALKLKAGKQYICDNLLLCYETLVSRAYLEAGELPLVRAWVRDLRTLGY